MVIPFSLSVTQEVRMVKAVVQPPAKAAAQKVVVAATGGSGVGASGGGSAKRTMFSSPLPHPKKIKKPDRKTNTSKFTPGVLRIPPSSSLSLLPFPLQFRRLFNRPS
jgi:hypothetical protein